MDQRVKKLWIAALQSDEFTQGHGALRTIEAVTGKPNDCCLGVLCELFRREYPKAAEWATSGEFVILTDTEHDIDECDDVDCDHQSTYNEYLPPEVMDWAGLGDNNPHMGEHCAGEWNDGDVKTKFDSEKRMYVPDVVRRAPKTFGEIAALVDEYL